jgi:sRNA-binding regulator protein Hfq
MGSKKRKAPETTLEEPRYLKQLAQNRTPVCIKLADNQNVRGVIEFFDEAFIRVTRENAPNLFVYKHDIKYLYEEPEGEGSAEEPSQLPAEPLQLPEEAAPSEASAPPKKPRKSRPKS